jgi:hypothetical protein
MSGYFGAYGLMQTSTYDTFVKDVIAPYTCVPAAAQHLAHRGHEAASISAAPGLGNPGAAAGMRESLSAEYDGANVDDDDS